MMKVMVGEPPTSRHLSGKRGDRVLRADPSIARSRGVVAPTSCASLTDARGVCVPTHEKVRHAALLSHSDRVLGLHWVADALGCDPLKLSRDGVREALI